MTMLLSLDKWNDFKKRVQQDLIESPDSLELSPIWLQRLRDLTDHIAQDLALLDDPRRQAGYLREIGALRQSATRYQQEYTELHAQVTGKPPAAMQDVATQLEQLDFKLDTLLAGQRATHEDLTYLRQDLLTRYDTGEQITIVAIIQQLSQFQLATVHAVLEALEANKVPEAEMEQLLAVAQQMLTVFQQHGVALPAQHQVAEAIAAPTLDVKHKLKITLPIIPLLLGYEGEVELENAIDLEAAWRQLVARIRGG